MKNYALLGFFLLTFAMAAPANAVAENSMHDKNDKNIAVLRYKNGEYSQCFSGMDDVATIPGDDGNYIMIPFATDETGTVSLLPRATRHARGPTQFVLITVYRTMAAWRERLEQFKTFPGRIEIRGVYLDVAHAATGTTVPSVWSTLPIGTKFYFDLPTRPFDAVRHKQVTALIEKIAEANIQCMESSNDR